jgi:hypothetical protein
MYLITELSESVTFSEQNVNDGKKSYFIEGVFIQGAIPNRNGRIYPMPVLEKEVTRYIKEMINDNRAVGELGHPDGPTINYDRVSHKIISLTREGNNYIGKAKILSNQPCGKIVENLLEENVKFGVSTRGIGSLVQKEGVMEVQEDFRLFTAADIVSDPSAPNAFVNGIMEGRQWIFDIASNSWKALQLVEQTKKAGKKLNEQEMLNIFQNYIKNLKNNK